MKILEKVLWAVDFNIDYKNTLEKVGQIIHLFGNEIILLHVLPNDLKNSSLKDFVERTVKEELEKIKSNLSGTSEHAVSLRIVYGTIADSILDVAEKEDVNLILVNAGDQYPENQTGMGLNAQKVVRNARKPVCIITNEPSKEKKHLVCPVDCSEPSALALQTAILSAKKYGSKLSVISVFEPINITSPRLLKAGVDEKAENETRFEQFRKEFEDFTSGFDFLDLSYEYILLRGIPHIEIVNFAQETDILYMGSTGKSGLRRILIGSVTEKVIQNVNCTVIVTKYEEIFKLRVSTEIEDIEQHYAKGNEMAGLGYYKEALGQYKMCLQINDLHLPSIKSLADLYEKLDDENQAEYYRKLSKTIMDKLMDRKIEEEVRKHYRLGN